jgi:lipopolysaccharide export system protein LptC
MTSQALGKPLGARALRLLHDLAYRLGLYLPVLVMAVLALATYWLVSNAPQPLTPELAAQPKHEPDYFMRDFALRNYDNLGVLLSEIKGAKLRHYPDTETLEIDQVRVESLRGGRLTVATANRALSNADGSEVQLLGNAVVVREAYRGPQGEAVPRLEFQGEFLHAFIDAERVQSHKPVVLMRGGDRFTADSLNYENLNRAVEMTGRVKGVLSPRK